MSTNTGQKVNGLKNCENLKLLKILIEYPKRDEYGKSEE
jgi:hypothetical protein